MWRVLKAELIYFLPWLFGGLGIATLVSLFLSVLVRFVIDGDGPPSFVIVLFPIIAGMVVAFIAQGIRIEERRARLLMAGPLSPRQLAGVMVLLPVCFTGLGVFAAVPILGLAALITGKFEPSALPQIAGFAGQFWAYAQLGPLAQESSAARRQQRSKSGLSGWFVFTAAILVLASSQFFTRSIYGYLGITMSAVTAMVFAAVLFVHRTDFTQ